MTTRLLVLLTVLFFLVHLALLDYRGLWGDEILTLGAINSNLRSLLINRARAGHSPIYFLGLKAWAHVFGSSMWSLRFPSLLASTAFFFSASLLFRTYLKKQTPYLVLLLFIHPFIFFLGQEARMYAISCFLYLLSTYFLLRHFRNTAEKSIRNMLISLGCLALSAAIHPIMSLAIPAHFAFMCLQSRRITQRWELIKNIGLISIPSTVALIASYFAFAYKETSRWNPKYAPSSQIFNLAGEILSGKLLIRSPLSQFNIELIISSLSMAVLVLTCLGLTRILAKTRLRKVALVTLSRNPLVLHSSLLVGTWMIAVSALSLANNPQISAHRYHGPLLVPGLVILVSLFALQSHSSLGKGINRTFMGLFCALVLLHGISHAAHQGVGYRETASVVNKLEHGPFRFFVYRDFQFPLVVGLAGISRGQATTHKIRNIGCQAILANLKQYSQPTGFDVLFFNLEETKYNAKEILESTLSCLTTELPTASVIENKIVGHSIIVALRNATVGPTLN